MPFGDFAPPGDFAPRLKNENENFNKENYLSLHNEKFKPLAPWPCLYNFIQH